MDERPFFKLSLSAFDDGDLRELEKFTKAAFSIDQVRSTAASLKYTRLAAQYLSDQMIDPDDEFVRIVGKAFYDGNLTGKVVERLKPNVKRAFEDLIRSRVRSRLEAALGDETTEGEEAADAGVEDLPPADGIVTTEEEMQAFYIVRAIAAEIVDPARITIRDQKSYCGILFDDNNRKPICRLYFDRREKQVGVFDSAKTETKHEVDGPEGIYRFAGAVRDVVKGYLV